jgi:hypothetical protein
VAISFFSFSGCVSTSTGLTETIQISILDNNETIQTVAPVGSSVQDVLDNAGIILNELDRVEPSTYSALVEPMTITITRILEEFDREESVIPFERQTVRNESLPEGESLLVQPGENGIQEITYRRVIENGIEISRSVFKIETIREARPEILMLGIQSPFIPIQIPGKLAYLTGGNAWVMEENTRQRRPVVTSADLDGRIFSISPNGEWLLFTRQGNSDTILNTLWIINLNEENAQPIYLQVDNVIHFAEWAPNRTATILYSTVEPRSTAPGWQANNNLYRLVFNPAGRVLRNEPIIETNAGGIYGWWGTSFRFSPDGNQIAYARPDSIGIVNQEEKLLSPLVEILPFQTRSDWAWVPGIAWNEDGSVLYFVNHAPMPGLNDPEASPIFDLSAFILPSGPVLKVNAQTGMFSYPSVSPDHLFSPNWVAYLEAIFPEQSETSRYRLMVMQQDGSNRRMIFPQEGGSGLYPQHVVWSPYLENTDTIFLGFVFQGNVWVISTDTWESKQITGDGLITRLDWK